MDELFDRLFNKAMTHKVSDIHMILKENLIIKMRIYGKLKTMENLSYDEGVKFLNYLKYKSNINTNYRLLPQTGHFEYLYMNRLYNLRLSYLPSLDFESVVIRVLNQYDHISLNTLTPHLDFNIQLEKLLQNENGLILICGSTGSGKTTTLYAMIDKLIENNDKNIITIEDPIEIKKQGCLQIQLNELIGLDYYTILKQILRHDPDVIMIGEIRDEKVAKIALTCALSGHLVLTTLHASSPYMALKRLINLSISELDLEDVLLASISQKLEYDEEHHVVINAQMMNQKQIKNYFKTKNVDYIQYGQ